MNKFLISAALVALGIGSALAQSQTSATTSTSEKTTTDDSSAKMTAAQKAADAFCVKQTGSHLRAITNDHPDRAVQCAKDPGRSYSREDIERTGASTTAEALRALDPSIH